MSLTFDIPGKPVPQGSIRSLGKGRPSVHGNAARLLPWRDLTITLAQQAMRSSGWQRTDSAVHVTVTFAYERPKSHYTSKGLLRPAAPRHPISRASADVDKTCRALFDALTVAGVIADDSQVVSVYATKTWGAEPSTSVTVRDLQAA